MKRNFVLGALILIVPVLLSGCSTNTSATPTSDYDKVGLIEYEACLDLGIQAISTSDTAFRGFAWSDPKLMAEYWAYVLKPCKEYRPIKEVIP